MKFKNDSFILFMFTVLLYLVNILKASAGDINESYDINRHRVQIASYYVEEWKDDEKRKGLGPTQAEIERGGPEFERLRTFDKEISSDGDAFIVNEKGSSYIRLHLQQSTSKEDWTLEEATRIANRIQESFTPNSGPKGVSVVIPGTVTKDNANLKLELRFAIPYHFK